ncbi:hypothetical protein WDZ11_14590 [Roseomonas mucosa]|uniref:hypothetical protein n=1 Tax=Roseomonas mucosa TaxID=207340 RepID=UPI0030CF6B18
MVDPLSATLVYIAALVAGVLFAASVSLHIWGKRLSRQIRADLDEWKRLTDQFWADVARGRGLSGERHDD